MGGPSAGVGGVGSNNGGSVNSLVAYGGVGSNFGSGGLASFSNGVAGGSQFGGGGQSNLVDLADFAGNRAAIVTNSNYAAGGSSSTDPLNPTSRGVGHGGPGGNGGSSTASVYRVNNAFGGRETSGHGSGRGIASFRSTAAPASGPNGATAFSATQAYGVGTSNNAIPTNNGFSPSGSAGRFNGNSAVISKAVPIPHLNQINIGPPSCSYNTSRSYCLKDFEYPTYDIQHAIEYHYAAVASLYKDVIANTDNSVDRLKKISDESYLCPSEVHYEIPLRAINTDGKWRIVVNNVKAHYETLSQTVRIEECTTINQQCQLLPQCYNSKCIQKYVYHRFLVYDPKDYYFPFSMETFKLPSACACYSGGYVEPHH